MFYVGLGLILGLGLAACNLPASGQPTAIPQPEITATDLQLPTDTPAPSPTPQPGRVVLLAPAGADPLQVELIQAKLAELSGLEGLQFETVSDMAASEIGDEIRLVVVLPPDPGVAALASANPETQFLAVAIPGLQTSRNLNTLGSAGDRPDQEGFLAGYLAAVVTQDWRVGVISSSDTVAGKAARLGFTNGTTFYCGLCRPAYPPFLQYPVFVELPLGASPEDAQAAADTLIANGVKTAYVLPDIGGEALLEYLAQKEINLIGRATPPTQLQSRWVATVRTDLASALEQIWPELMNGEGGINLDVPLVITDRNAALFSPGRQSLVEKLLADLLAGYIDTGVNPQTGEPR